MANRDKEMRSKCVQLFLLNIFDTLITLFALTMFPDRFVEANPLMDYAITQSHGLFAFGKIFVGTLVAWLLYWRRENKSARVVATVALVLYWGIAFYNTLLLATVQGLFGV